MAIDIACTNCGHQLRVPETVAGKRIRCPKCKGVVQVPGSESTTSGPAADEWHVKTEDGQTFGPIAKHELDSWVQEGRVTAECQLLSAGAESWQWASDEYPQLAPQESPAPTAVPVQIATQSIKASTSRSGIGLGLPEIAGAQRPSFKHRSYPAMVTASKIYYIFGWIVLVLGGVGVAGFLVMTVGAGVGAATSGDQAAGALGGILLLYGISGALVMAVYVGLMVVSLWFMSEAIKAVIDIQDNTHKASYFIERLAARETNEK